MIYADFYDFDEGKVALLLKSENPLDQLDGLLYTVLGSGNYEESDRLISHFTHSKELSLKNNSYLCISHLVRIHKKLDLTKYLPLLEEVIQHQHHELLDNTEYAIEGIWIFLPHAKTFDFAGWSCINRFIEVLRIQHLAEEEETFITGISKLEILKKTESNPSILNIIDTCIESLGYMNED